MDRDIIKVKMSKEVADLIRHTSQMLAVPISHIMRNVLIDYKINGEAKNKSDNDDYSAILHIATKDNFTSQEYQAYGDNISNEDIVNILEKLYNIEH